MNVADVMSRDVEFISQEATIKAAAELMGEIEVGALPVGTPEQMAGIITDRDILYRVVARGLDPTTTHVRDILSKPVISCSQGDTVKTAMDAMAANHIRRLPVMDATDKVVGWLTMADLSRLVLLENVALQDALRDLTEND